MYTSTFKNKKLYLLKINSTVHLRKLTLDKVIFARLFLKTCTPLPHYAALGDACDTVRLWHCDTVTLSPSGHFQYPVCPNMTTWLPPPLTPEQCDDGRRLWSSEWAVISGPGDRVRYQCYEVNDSRCHTETASGRTHNVQWLSTSSFVCFAAGRLTQPNCVYTSQQTHSPPGCVLQSGTDHTHTHGFKNTHRPAATGVQKNTGRRRVSTAHVTVTPLLLYRCNTPTPTASVQWVYQPRLHVPSRTLTQPLYRTSTFVHDRGGQSHVSSWPPVHQRWNRYSNAIDQREPVRRKKVCGKSHLAHPEWDQRWGWRAWAGRHSVCTRAAACTNRAECVEIMAEWCVGPGG